MQTRDRRRTALAGTVALLLHCIAPCHAQGPGSTQTAFPQRALRLVIPFAPGGTNDIIGRLVAQKAGENLGQSIVADNRAGAGGLIGSAAVAKATPDGYTLLLGHIGTLAVNPTLYSKLPYDPLRDFIPITLVARLPNLLAVNPAVPVKTLAELIALAKAKPGAVSYGSGGVGGAGHLASEYLGLLAAVKLTHVPYRGTGPAVVDVVSGQLSMVLAGVPAIVPHVRSGQLRAIAVSGPTRLKVLPEIPTMMESGLPGYEATQWYGIVAPTSTPGRIIERLHSAITSAVMSPEIVERFAADGAEAAISTPEEFNAFIRKEIARWAPVIKAAGIRE
ncbi:MAG: tripartite tricarboxylate transporter substrate binding protein [Proteobacteria bacterium]|nr:tripartite tricarboxylate transporter substrate binding protein [Burkholderiales bacterium]